MTKTLVAYFSPSATTGKVAKTLAEAASADLYEIKPEIAYTPADLDWRDEKSRTTLEMADPSSRPALADQDLNLEPYDVVYLGFPIWWATAPRVINTFLESYEFADKTIVLFSTSGSGTDFGTTAENLKASVSSSTVIKEGKVFPSVSTPADVDTWVRNLGF